MNTKSPCFKMISYQPIIDETPKANISDDKWPRPRVSSLSLIYASLTSFIHHMFLTSLFGLTHLMCQRSSHLSLVRWSLHRCAFRSVLHKHERRPLSKCYRKCIVHLVFSFARRCHSVKINKTLSPTPSRPAPCNQAQIINKKYLLLSRNALWDWRYPPSSFGLTCPNSSNIPSSCGVSVVLDMSVCDHQGRLNQHRAAILKNTLKKHDTKCTLLGDGHKCNPGI